MNEKPKAPPRQEELDRYAAQLFAAMNERVKEGDVDGFLSFAEIASHLSTARVMVMIDDQF